MALLIRDETAADALAITRVTELAFLNAAHTSHTEQFIVGALRAAGALTVSLIAQIDDDVIGHAAASPVQISTRSPGWFGLGPVSVAPAHQRHGVGTALIHRLLQRLQDIGASGCVVLGEPAYYGRFGFQCEASLVLPGVPPEYFQAIRWSDGIPAGTVAYHAAFEAVA